MTQPRQLIGYTVTDRRTGQVLRRYKAEGRRAAYRFADKKDLEYGAIRYGVDPLYAEQTAGAA